MRMIKKIFVLKRFQWLRLLTFLALFSTFCGLLSTFFTNPRIVDNNQTNVMISSNYDLNFDYPNNLEKIRLSEMKHLPEDSVYLDYTGAGIYNDAVFDIYQNELQTKFFPGHSLKSFPQTTADITEQIKNEIFSFVGAKKEDYSVIFVASATQALKLVGEIFPWEKDSSYVYTKFNHNSVLGIRQYVINANATFKAIEWPPSIEDIKSVGVSTNAMNLLAFPLEDNFAGTKPDPKVMYDITHDTEIKKNFAILGDVAAYLPTNPLNLTEIPLDACCISFYKILGYPNTGALIIRNDFIQKIQRKYQKQLILQDDPVPIELNLAVYHGLRYLRHIGMNNIQNHVWNLTRKLYEGMNNYFHSNGNKVIEIYGYHDKNNSEIQGGIISFNIKKIDGSYYGYSTIVSDASEFGYHLRGGCHCNPGACFHSMKISEKKAKSYYDQKTTCGDENDIIDGIPLGSVRASLGWASTEKDVNRFLEWIQDNFVF